MSRIVLDDETLKKFGTLDKMTLLYDSRGNVVGVLAPNRQPQLQPQISEDEYQRRLREGRTYTTEEVLKHLESL